MGDDAPQRKGPPMRRIPVEFITHQWCKALPLEWVWRQSLCLTMAVVRPESVSYPLEVLSQVVVHWLRSVQFRWYRTLELTPGCFRNDIGIDRRSPWLPNT